MKYPPASRSQPEAMLSDALGQNVVSQPLPVRLCILETLRPGSEVFSLRTRKTAIVFSDSGPFLKGINVRDLAHGEHPSGSLI